MKQFQTQYGAKAEKPREIKKTLGKDDFLRIMITQMKNQDPSKPFNADEMAQQMAQYASVEQLQNVNQNIQKLDNNNKTTERMAMTGMIGKTVTVDRERFQHVESQGDSLSYSLPKNAASVKLTIQAENGEPILEKDLGPQKVGEQSFSWDGAKSNTLPAKSGTFVFKIVALDEKGISIPTNPQTRGKVIGVGFEGAEPVFLVGDAKAQQKVTMKNIIKIEDAAPQPSFGGLGGAGALGLNPAILAQIGAPGAGQVPGQLGQAQAQQTGGPGQPAEAPGVPGNNFFGFKKGEGSSQSLDPSAMSPEAAEALARYQAQQAAAGAPQAPSAGGQAVANSAPAAAGSGFPNGLPSAADDGVTPNGQGGPAPSIQSLAGGR
jgi:flagellar basal-body rod modification protein FlgD